MAVQGLIGEDLPEWLQEWLLKLTRGDGDAQPSITSPNAMASVYKQLPWLDPQNNQSEGMGPEQLQQPTSAPTTQKSQDFKKGIGEVFTNLGPSKGLFDNLAKTIQNPLSAIQQVETWMTPEQADARRVDLAQKGFGAVSNLIPGGGILGAIGGQVSRVQANQAYPNLAPIGFWEDVTQADEIYGSPEDLLSGAWEAQRSTQGGFVAPNKQAKTQIADFYNAKNLGDGLFGGGLNSDDITDWGTIAGSQQTTMLEDQGLSLADLNEDDTVFSENYGGFGGNDDGGGAYSESGQGYNE